MEMMSYLSQKLAHYNINHLLNTIKKYIFVRSISLSNGNILYGREVVLWTCFPAICREIGLNDLILGTTGSSWRKTFASPPPHPRNLIPPAALISTNPANRTHAMGEIISATYGDLHF